MITSNLPLPSMHSMIQHESHTARTVFLMPFQWCTLFHAESTAWERTMAFGHFWPIHGYYIQVKHQYTTHEPYDQSRIFNANAMVSLVLRKLYCVGNFDAPSPFFYIFQVCRLVTCSHIMIVSTLIECKMFQTPIGIKVNIMGAPLLVILTE